MIRISSMGRSFARQRAMKLDWSNLVTPRTPKAQVEQMSAMARSVQDLREQAGSLPAQVPKIDWAHWEKTITSPGVVAQIKAEYEGLKFETHDISKYQAKFDEVTGKIQKAETELARVPAEINETDKCIAYVNKLKHEGKNYSLEDWYKVIPGLEEELKSEYDNEEYLRSDLEEKVMSMDFAQVRKDFVEGKDINIQLPEKIGSFNIKEGREARQRDGWSVKDIPINFPK